jgi:ferric-dicitrate binding protein FerR (iron transport regulator)
VTSPTGMDRERFRALLASYGADFAKWPEDERARAEAFTATSHEAAQWLAEEQRLDQLLDAAPELLPSAALLRRVAEIPARNTRAVAQPFERLRRWIAGAVALAAVGAAVGAVMPESSLDADVASADELSPLGWAGDLAEELAP